MGDSKIDFSFENLHFACEGDNDWVEKQLNNVLSRIPSLLAVHRKGENVVEEVIDVQEVTSPGARQPKVRKPKKDKTVAAVKDDIVEVPVEKLAKAPKAKTPRIPKAPKAPKSPKASKSTKAPKSPKLPKTPRAAKVPKAPKAIRAKATGAPKTVEIAKEKVKKAPKVKPVKVTKVKAPKLPKEKNATGRTDTPFYQFLAEKKAEKNQVRKFLAAAVYLAKSNDHVKLSTPMISKALKSAGIERLQNASDCLNKNEKKGYCVKEGKNFIITENGFLAVG